MEYRAEIFDQMQLLYDETGFNDHQVHCEIGLASPIDERLLKKALLLTLSSIPILATRYSALPARASWVSLPPDELERAFAATDDAAVFESARTCRIPETEGPQVRLCLLRGERGAIAVTMNHMVADGSGFKEYLYFLAECYSRLHSNPDYSPATKIEGDRGFDDVLRSFGAWTRLRVVLSQGRESNRRGSIGFPLSTGDERRPFIATRVVAREKVERLKAYCRPRGATINDAALAAYCRALARVLGPSALAELEVPIMIDMRRHLPQCEFKALRNLASTVAIRLEMKAGESFEETLERVKRRVDWHKARRLGLGGFVKMSLLFHLFGEARALRLLRGGLRHPLICMTNLGELDAARLVFEGTRVGSAYVCGSIKHKPHFQLALSGFAGSLTLSSNLYGSREDRERIEAFLALVEEELSPFDERGDARFAQRGQGGYTSQISRKRCSRSQ